MHILSKPIACPWNTCGGNPSRSEAGAQCEGHTKDAQPTREPAAPHSGCSAAPGGSPIPSPSSALSPPQGTHPERSPPLVAMATAMLRGGCPASLRGSRWRPAGVGARRPGLCLYLTAQDGERPLPRTRGCGSASCAFTFSGHPCSFIFYILLPLQCERTSLSCFFFVVFF